MSLISKGSSSAIRIDGIARPCCAIPASDRSSLRTRQTSKHPHSVRHPEPCHPIQHGTLDGSLDLLVLKDPRAELPSEYRLEAKHRVLWQALPGAAARRSPPISALCLNRPQRCIARHTPSRWIRSRADPRVTPWHDGCDSVTRQYGLVACKGIARPIARDLSDDLRHPREQCRAPA